MLEKSMVFIKHCQKRIQKRVLPYYCLFCAQAAETQDLCSACLQDLPIVAQKCPRCAQNLVGAEPGQSCGSCLQNPPSFSRAYSLFAYEEPVITLILDLKFYQQLAYARILGELLAAKIQQDWYRKRPLPDLLIPVPLHRERLQERGFNQALEIARPVAKILKLPLETEKIQRRKNTPAQRALKAAERRRNLKNAFHYEGSLFGKTIALLDDVMTTGSTLNALGEELLTKGAASVEAWCCARR